MKLSTPVTVDNTGFTLDHANASLLVGSCFTEYMGERMQALRFPVCLNPFGILYNPLSMAEALSRCLDNRPLTADELVSHDGLWHSWLHHGSFSQPDRDACLHACNDAIRQAHVFLQRCDRMVLTFGSAWYFVEKTSRRIVANCHKLPAANFDRHLASADDIVAAWNPLLDRLSSSGIEVLFTISPVRHWAYGPHGNHIGKAPLFLAVDTFCSSRRAQCHYFPAYEIMMDELRDYRFYADDMLHPSPLAQDIIWQRFQEAYMSPDTIGLCNMVDKLNRLRQHRMLHPSDEACARHQALVGAQQQQVEEMLSRYNKSPKL